MTYNPELLNLELPSSSSPDITYTVIENTPWIITVIINFETALQVESETEIYKVLYTKLSENTAQVNLINTNFTDTNWEKYLLTSQGAIK
jgi:CRISPR/Cas system CSM-associated protein Csm4 (group 5 of RAMP superfamily)